MYVCVIIDGFWLITGFIDHWYTPLGSTINYNATANLHNSQITTAPSKPFPSLLCLQQPFLVEILRLPALTSLLLGEYPATERFSTVNSTITPSLISLPCRARLNWKLTHQPATSLHFTSLHPLIGSDGLGSSLNNLGAGSVENIPISIVTVLSCVSRFRGNMFTELLPSNAYSFSRWMHSKFWMENIS
jgi:hypothetical protein